MIKAIILEHADFSKELSKIVVSGEFDMEVELFALKAICNFAVDN